jgi:hypothetical protein
VLVYLVDYGQDQLRPVTLAADLLDTPPEPVKVVGTMAGRAFQTQELLTAERDGGWLVWVPIRERAERMGVLELGFDVIDDDILQLCENLGRLVGHLIHSAGRYTDAMELARRRSHMVLTAELQWDMLVPPLAFSSPEVEIAGMLEPAYEVAGDGFDYALNGERLDIAIFDAMGHGLHSCLASVLALAGYRYGRRRNFSLIEMANQIDEALVGQFDGELFVTAHLGQLDTATGVLQLLNAGHPDPLLFRGGRMVGELHAEPCFPLGLEIKVSRLGQWQLQPGDGVLLYSDGVIEARPSGGEEFGFDRMQSVLEAQLQSNLPPAEALRRLVHDVLTYRSDTLADDATLVYVEWRGGGI